MWIKRSRWNGPMSRSFDCKKKKMLSCNCDKPQTQPLLANKPLHIRILWWKFFLPCKKCGILQTLGTDECPILIGLCPSLICLIQRVQGPFLNMFFVVVCLMVFNATFNNISVVSWRSVLLVEESGGPRENLQPVSSHWQTYHMLLYTSPWSKFELTTSVVIGTDCICSCKSNYHTITPQNTWYYSTFVWYR